MKQQRSSQPISTISLFSGSGGMDLGFMRAGFEIRAAVEADPAACATLRRNWPAHEDFLIERRLEDVTTAELLRVAGLRVGEVGLVMGGPPCQSWCVAGNRKGLEDPRGQALLEFCRVVREAKPRVFCIENVPGLLSHGKRDILNIIADSINTNPKATYQIAAEVLNAADFGVAQHRRRVFVIGWRTRGEFYFPSATHNGSTRQKRRWRRDPRTVRDAFEGLPAPLDPSPTAYRVAATISKRNKKWYGK